MKSRWRPLTERFWANVPDLDPSVCWEWQGGLNSNGYGTIWGDGKRWTASRLVWTLRYGAVPEGLCVLHRCDNRPCVNPAHLFLGTIADNQRDMQQKGRGQGPTLTLAQRRTRKTTKLTENDAAIIRSSVESGRVLARRFGVSEATISLVRHRKTWWPPLLEDVA